MKIKNIIFAFAVLMGSAFALGANSSVLLTIGNSAPVINSVAANSADPGFCTDTTTWVTFNVTDNDGYDDIDLASTYVKLTKGSVEHQSTSCTIDSHGTTWAVINCSGITMDFYDAEGDWTEEVHVVDNSASSDDDSGTSFTYNGVASVNTTGVITFGTLYAGTDDNENTNSPAIMLRNCGNQIINCTITGSDVTGAGTITVEHFSVSNVSGSTTGEMVLSTSPQQFTPADNLASGPASNISIYYYADIPAGQTNGVYDTANFQWIAEEA